MKPLNAIARRAQAMANLSTQDFYTLLVAMIAKQQGIGIDDKDVNDVKMVETNTQTLRDGLKRQRDDWAKMALANLNTDGWVAVEDAKKKAMTVAEQILREAIKER